MKANQVQGTIQTGVPTKPNAGKLSFYEMKFDETHNTKMGRQYLLMSLS